VAELIIRRATLGDADAIARIRIDGWRTTYRDLIPAAYLESMEQQASRALWEKILTAGSSVASVFVAANEDNIVAFAAGNILREPKHGFDAELTAVYVRLAFQRAGIGRRLVGAVVAALREQHATGLIVWVLAGNKGARTFYEQLGAELLIEQTFQWDDLQLVETGYGWRDLDALSRACANPSLPPNAILQ
jgi:GNAT superfamily N-acetyltransferase